MWGAAAASVYHTWDGFSPLILSELHEVGSGLAPFHRWQDGSLKIRLLSQPEYCLTKLCRVSAVGLGSPRGVGGCSG